MLCRIVLVSDNLFLLLFLIILTIRDNIKDTWYSNRKPSVLFSRLQYWQTNHLVGKLLLIPYIVERVLNVF